MHYANYSTEAVGKILGHNERSSEGVYSREFDKYHETPNATRIRREDAHKNYCIGIEDPLELTRKVKKRISDCEDAHAATVEAEKARGEKVRHLKMNAARMTSILFTLPKDAEKEDEDAIFKEVFLFMQNRYGPENVLGGYIHKDETTPHIHIPLIPFKDGRLSRASVITKRDLDTVHQDLDKYLKQKGFDVSVLLDPSKPEENLRKALSGLSQSKLSRANAAIKEIVAEKTRRATEGKVLQLTTKENELNEREKHVSGEEIKYRKSTFGKREAKVIHRENVLDLQEQGSKKIINNKMAQATAMLTDAEKKKREAEEILREAQRKSGEYHSEADLILKKFKHSLERKTTLAQKAIDAAQQKGVLEIIKKMDPQLLQQATAQYEANVQRSIDSTIEEFDEIFQSTNTQLNQFDDLQLGG